MYDGRTTAVFRVGEKGAKEVGLKIPDNKCSLFIQIVIFCPLIRVVEVGSQTAVAAAIYTAANVVKINNGAKTIIINDRYI